MPNAPSMLFTKHNLKFNLKFFKMCGIFCIFAENSNSETLLKAYETCKAQLDRRGPDFQSIKVINVKHSSLVFASSVLWLQGEDIIQQPIETNNSIFVYNGNLYNESDLYIKSDTEVLLDLLDNTEDIVTSLSSIQGPYAFIYLDKRTSKLYFCRDVYGRRSLLIGTNGNNFLLSSVACKALHYNCVEVPAVGIFCYDLNYKSIAVFPWKFKHKNFGVKLTELEELLGKNIEVKEQNNEDPKPYIPPTEKDLQYCQDLQSCEVQDSFKFLLTNPAWKIKIETLKNLLGIAVHKRVITQPKFCINCLKERKICDHASTGVLFSGGVDCSILALLADSSVDKNRPIDLLNVAFNSNAPDRKTAIESLAELKQIQPNRIWNFVEINITEEELTSQRSKYIADLVYPRDTILDDSLGCALWFASRGQNGIYKSPCRILLVGMGADELFGGYTRHRAILKHAGWSGLHESLEEDWQNISHRNLARDDRVVSDHGRQLCTPYLDENVVQFVRSLNCWEKTCPIKELPQGLGEKILLRSLAYEMGLKNAAYLKKRALQFGSRIANRKENANDVSPRL